MTKAAAPSETIAQSSRCSGEVIIREPSTSATVIGSSFLRQRIERGVAADRHRHFRHLLRRGAVLVHVALRDERVQRRHQRAIRRLELRVRPTGIRDLLHGGAARMIRELVLPGDAQHRLGLAGRNRHGGVVDHRGARGARDIQGGEIARPHSQLLRHHAYRHRPVGNADRRGQEAIHVLDLQSGVFQRGMGRSALQLQRAHAWNGSERAFAHSRDDRKVFQCILNFKN